MIKLVDDPSLADVLNLKIRELLLTLNCHQIGRVEKVDFTKQTITASLQSKKIFLDENGDQVIKDYTPLYDVPFVVLGGGGGCLTFPIAPGDECLLLFADRDIDNWFQSGQSSAPNTTRLHSFSDAVALVGINSLAKSIKNYDQTRAVLRAPGAGTAMVGAGGDLVKIANSTTTLGAVLGQLITALNTAATNLQANASAEPAAAATGTALATALATIKTSLQGLLE